MTGVQTCALPIWFKGRVKASLTAELNHKNIYIFPSYFGWGLLILCLALFLLGTNYQNNLILALCYLLISLFLVSMLHAFHNLNRLKIECKIPELTESGALLSFPVVLMAKKPKFNIHLLAESLRASNDILEDKSEVSLFLEDTTRGIYPIERIKIISFFPLGLFVTWAYCYPHLEGEVYPSPLDGEMPGEGDNNYDDSGISSGQRGTDEFSELRKHQAGDSNSRVAWRLLAQQKGLWTREFEQHTASDTWLDFSEVRADSIEDKLSVLCFWILQLETKGESYGLKLPYLTIPVGSGVAHQRKCLSALARVGYVD